MMGAKMTISPDEQLNELRKIIDRIDYGILKSLSERFKYTMKVGLLKSEHNIPSVDPNREKRQIKRLRALAKKQKISADLVENIMRHVIDEAIKQHNEIKAGKHSSQK